MTAAEDVPAAAAATPRPFRAALLTLADGGLGLARHLRGAAGLEIVAAAAVEDLVEAARHGGADLVVLDPELTCGWPVDAAEAVARGLGGSVPLVVLCHSREDAEQIEHRVGRHATVLLLDGSGAEELPAILAGLVAQRRHLPRS